MGKRKGRQSKNTAFRFLLFKNIKSMNTETLNNSWGGEDEFRNGGSEDSKEGEKSGFFACYLLTSLCPRYKGHTYIGFTVNPRRRIRQHNGELCSGANSTKTKRPWEMVLCIYGFPTNVAALQFEWAWQNPLESVAVRDAAVGFKSFRGLANQIKLVYTMLTLPAWNKLNLNVNFFSTKYTKHKAGCPSLPGHMRVHVRSMDELPCYTHGHIEDDDDILRFENDLLNDDEEEEPILVSKTHQNHEQKKEEEEATSVSDTENPERPSCSNNNDLCDDNEEAFLFPSDLQYHQGPTYVSDAEPLWVYDSPVRPYMEYSGDVSNSMSVDVCGGVEVIDIFSPSPVQPRKKRAGFVDCPEVIDLTQSPICV